MIYPDFIIQKPSNQLAESSTNLILKNSDSFSYHLTLNEYNPSPLCCLHKLARWLGVGEIYIKDESARFGLNAFKGLGTSYTVHQLIKSSGNISVFCTATEGNHGRALAWSAAMALR